MKRIVRPGQAKYGARTSSSSPRARARRFLTQARTVLAARIVRGDVATDTPADPNEPVGRQDRGAAKTGEHNLHHFGFVSAGPLPHSLWTRPPQMRAAVGASPPRVG